MQMLKSNGLFTERQFQFCVVPQQSHSALEFSKEKYVSRIMLWNLFPSEPKLGLELKILLFMTQELAKQSVGKPLNSLKELMAGRQSLLSLNGNDQKKLDGNEGMQFLSQNQCSFSSSLQPFLISSYLLLGLVTQQMLLVESSRWGQVEFSKRNTTRKVAFITMD